MPLRISVISALPSSPTRPKPTQFQTSQTPSKARGGTTHAAVLHASASSLLPHVVPPFFAVISAARRRVRRPPPHDAEHSSHWPHAPGTHATAQSVASSSAGHARPSDDGRVATGRMRSFRPVAATHSDQPLHAPTAQSTCKRRYHRANHRSALGTAVPPAKDEMGRRALTAASNAPLSAAHSVFLRSRRASPPENVVGVVAASRLVYCAIHPQPARRTPAVGKTSDQWAAAPVLVLRVHVGGVDLQAAHRRVPPVPSLRRIAAAAGSPWRPSASRARRSARPALARGRWSPRTAPPVPSNRQRPTHCHCRVERARVFSHVPRNVPA
jgi:hypothetical protein